MLGGGIEDGGSTIQMAALVMLAFRLEELRLRCVSWTVLWGELKVAKCNLSIYCRGRDRVAISSNGDQLRTVTESVSGTRMNAVHRRVASSREAKTRASAARTREVGGLLQN